MSCPSRSALAALLVALELAPAVMAQEPTPPVEAPPAREEPAQGPPAEQAREQRDDDDDDDEDQELILSLRDLRVGHWVQVKGTYIGGGDMDADEIELLRPKDENELVGAVTRILTEKRRFWVLGHLVHTDEDTEWEGIELRDLPGRRVKVKGNHRSARKFSGDEVSPRGPGRDSLEGRVDEIRTTVEGTEILVGNLRVLVDSSTDFVSRYRPERLELAELKHQFVPLKQRQFRDEDDRIPGSIAVTDDLSLGALVELETRTESEFDLDPTSAEDRTDASGSATLELRWEPDPDFTGLFRGRASYLHRTEADELDENTEDMRVSELWGYWARTFGSDFDLQFGRQDFDEPREWLYDQNLDALKLIYRRPGFRTDLSVSTVFSDSSPRDENSLNLIGYVSNNDFDRHLAAYVIDRRDDRSPRDYPIHFGVRALGEWLPYNWSWAEFSVLRGYSDDVNLESWGLDVGSTWSPPFLRPVNLTLGYAMGTGDDPGTQDVDEGFRQTGFHDNNGTWGGVTSFRYYGELVDPELSNLAIFSAGVGWRFHRRGSLDLVFHHYRQVRAADSLRDTELDMRPDGENEELGNEIDLILGIRAQGMLDLKFVLAMFVPGEAFPDGERAVLGSTRLRFRF